PCCALFRAEAVDEPVALLFSLDGTRYVEGAGAVAVDAFGECAVGGSAVGAVLPRVEDVHLHQVAEGEAAIELEEGTVGQLGGAQRHVFIVDLVGASASLGGDGARAP